MDRAVMEGDPHAVIEGMAIAAHATGAAYGFMYLRHEYPLAHKRVWTAINQARERGLLGENILGSGLSFDMEVVRGAGSYVCGEETGLIASIEDSRGMPKIRPPFPAQSGVFAKPTNVNNVETYADVSLLFRDGLEKYRSAGTERNSGTKMFSLSGHIQRVGVVEVPLGTPVARLVYEIGGGLPEGRTLKAIQPGGPLAGILPADHTQGLLLEPEEFRPHNVQMGGGGIVVVDDSACIIDLCLHFERFAEEESCGRCTTCRGGTQRLVDILRRIARGEGRADDVDKMRLLADTMRYANCVHGQAAPTVVMNSIEFFMEELKAHIFEKRCPARVCKGLVRYEVAGESDKLPEAAAICPTEAIIRSETGGYRISQERCIKCGACREIAPDAVQLVDELSC
jgi:NADH:ubiquinone oxidoreductase subunit F (NADH-binding)